jgi:hypothetical protein
MDPHLSGRAARSLETLHALGYFAPEVDQEIAALGVRSGRAAYFASRAAAMGPVGPGPVTATFYNFSPGLVERCVPSCWATTTPAEVLAARLRGVDAAYRRLFDETTLASPEIVEMAELVRTAAGGCDPAGRTLYAAHAELAWPVEPHLALWHGLTLLREHRGDGHLAALLGAGLSGLEALVSHTATGKGFTVTAARKTRGWSEEEWSGAVASLSERGLMSADGELTEHGVGMRAAVETATDLMGAEPWDVLGEEGTLRLRTLGKPLVRTALAGGAFPEGTFA